MLTGTSVKIIVEIYVKELVKKRKVLTWKK